MVAEEYRLSSHWGMAMDRWNEEKERIAKTRAQTKIPTNVGITLFARVIAEREIVCYTSGDCVCTRSTPLSCPQVEYVHTAA